MIELARDPLSPDQLNACAAAARSFEATAHMVGLEAGAELARSMEECLAAVRRGDIELQQQLIGMMLQAVDLLDSMAKLPRTTPIPPLPPSDDGRRRRTGQDPARQAQAGGARGR